ncbi:ABC transporter ATP-binding protein [Leucobacter viscericola]|uniref:ABC transporter ATP-binding protein n=1 Tax=Leucobacter viscericola TaxID=2714935 RepID=A0A6G7XDP4_9MICO|nr:ABC transporter ATP-binding protein [Leucobacter viscericola]
MPKLTFEDVSITYRTSGENGRGEVSAVKSVSLELPAGGTLGIAGESGSGKSTLAMSALRLLPKNARLDGRVLIGDTDVAKLNFGELRAVRWAQASIVFQGAMHSLNPVHTVGDQILEALETHVTDRWRTSQARESRVRELLEIVDLPTQKMKSYPHELSGGQKQRIMIAMALACEPEIIIADEPTTALDVIVQKQILDMISRLVAERGISLLMISHDLSVLATACDRIAVMRNGELVEVGEARMICTEPNEPYTRKLADAFPTIGDPASRLRPVTRHGAGAEEPGESKPSDEVLLSAKGVNVTYHGSGGHHAVRDVDLEVHRGEIVVLVGQSGSGKTTLARALMGLQPTDQGSDIRFLGKPLPEKGKALKLFRRSVQLVLQDPSAALNPKLSVYESVAEGLRVQGLTTDEKARVAQSLVDAELSPPEQYFGAIPQELSGGQRQRVVIAGALALHPEMLIADEPVASLDASVRGEILGLLLSLKKRLGLSALVITHDLGLAWNIADRVAVMYHGEIVEQGTTEEVLLSPKHPYTRELLAAAPAFWRRCHDPRPPRLPRVRSASSGRHGRHHRRLGPQHPNEPQPHGQVPRSVGTQRGCRRARARPAPALAAPRGHRRQPQGRPGERLVRSQYRRRGLPARRLRRHAAARRHQLGRHGGRSYAARRATEVTHRFFGRHSAARGVQRAPRCSRPLLPDGWHGCVSQL